MEKQLTKHPSFQKFMSRLRILVLAGFLLIAGLVFFYFVSMPVLLDWFLYYETPLEPVDIVLLGGTGTGLETVVEYYRNGHAKTILITKAVPEEYKEIDKHLFPYHFIREELRKAGVPDEDVFSIGKEAHSMLERQVIFRNWIHSHNVHSYLCFPGYYTARFTKIIHDHTFSNGDVKAVIRPYQGRHILRKQLLGLHNSMIRMIYWYLVYRPQLQSDT